MFGVEHSPPLALDIGSDAFQGSFSLDQHAVIHHWWVLQVRGESRQLGLQNLPELPTRFLGRERNLACNALHHDPGHLTGRGRGALEEALQCSAPAQEVLLRAGPDVVKLGPASAQGGTVCGLEHGPVYFSLHRLLALVHHLPGYEWRPADECVARILYPCHG